jgi:hypothetical protein
MMCLRVCRVIAVLSCLPCAAACLTSTALVTVRPDGSGRFEQTTVIRPAALAEFEKLSAPDAANRTTAEELWAEILKRARSTRAGDPPVTPVRNGDMMGISVSYEFQHVSTLFGFDLLPSLPGLGSFWSVASPEVGASTRLRMTLVPINDGLERLTVHFPRFRLSPTTEPPSAWASGSAAEMAALKSVMTGAHVTIAVATESPLLRTNSPFREGNRVTLLDADIAEALFSREVQRMVATPGTFDELLSWYATVPA